MFDTLDATQATAVLGAMTTVIEPWPRGEPTLGRKLVAAAADLLFGLDPDRVDAMPVAPDRLRVALDGRNEATVKHVAELIAVAALVDGRVAADRVRVALDHARHLGVRAPWVGELSDVADGHLDRAMHEMVIRNAATFPGLSVPGTEPDLLPYDGRSDADRRLHARFEDLEGFPDGSYGRAFWVHFRRHGFRFPGQDGAFNGAFAVPHDALHVLTGYDTSMQGEVLVSTFTGRMHRRDALSAHLLPVIFQWHIGLEVNGIGAQQGALDPAKFLVAWRRGAATTTDVLAPDWRFFDVADEPLEAVRRRYGIADLPELYRAAGPEVNLTAEADRTVH